MMNLLITGAAGNLGTLLSRHIRDNEKDINLILMQHRKKLPEDISENSGAKVRVADLSNDWPQLDPPVLSPSFWRVI